MRSLSRISYMMCYCTATMSETDNLNFKSLYKYLTKRECFSLDADLVLLME